MAAKVQREVPAGMQRFYRRFEGWRSSRRGRLPIPEAMWASAAAAVRSLWKSGGRTLPDSPAAPRKWIAPVKSPSRPVRATWMYYSLKCNLLTPPKS